MDRYPQLIDVGPIAVKVFFSYSHYDEPALTELRKHLSVLRREGSITEWYDRKLLPGDNFDNHIDENIEQSDLIILLASHHFLSSDYCFNVEMKKALERHYQGDGRIVSIILEPCDWKSTELSKLAALPLDGKPISVWTNANSAYLNIVDEFRKIIISNNPVELPYIKSQQDYMTRTAPQRYRSKREFGAVDRTNFRKESFKIIESYFSNAVDEINAIDGISAAYDPMDSSAFCCCIENHLTNRGPSYITVRIGGGQVAIGDIYYSNSERASSGTAHGSFLIGASDFQLFFTPVFGYSTGSNSPLSAEQIAEAMWNDLVDSAGIDYA